MTPRNGGHVIARLIRMRRLGGLGAAVGAVVGVVVALGIVAVPGVAQAACAPSPSLSPYGFAGTVIRLGPDDRQAFVQKDDGTVVEVDGGSIGGGVSGEDLDFVLGARYRIEPENSAPPFLVNDCTATARLGLTLVSPSPSLPVAASPAVSAPAAAPASAELTVFPTSAAQPDFLTIAVFVVLSALLIAIAFAVRIVRDRRHRWD